MVFLFDTSRRIFMLEVVDVMAYIMEDSMVVIFVDIMVDWRLLYYMSDTIVDQCLSLIHI